MEAPFIMTEKAHVLVIAPHPDDAETRSAGSVARWVREGKDVVYVVCTNGDKGTGDPTLKPEELVGIREKEQMAAAEILGVREVIFLKHPDQQLEDSPDFRREIVRLIRTYRPDTIITIDPYERYLSHRDHRKTGLVTLEAIAPAGTDTAAFSDLSKKGLKPHRVKELLFCGFEGHDYHVDITGTFDIKIAALKCHRSQVGDRSEFFNHMKERAKMEAEAEDYELAEAFRRVEVDWDSITLNK
jgi:LmbE family N-acetylglucosaminyl deacetylase